MPSLTADLEAAARIGADPRGGVSRFAWTPELAEANDWLAERLAALGLEVELDPAGNLVGRWQAGEGKAVLVGSHLDTVPNGGRYDGALGVLAALDVVRRLRAEGVEPRRPLWVVSFNDEEGGRFQTGMLGSRAFCGDCDLPDWGGRGVPEAMADAGFDFARLADARAIDGVGAYLELHIEQGPVLEHAGIDLGVVTAITGMVGYRARFVGEANHAGTTPMAHRRDALAGAARAVLALRDEARSRVDMTANVGVISAEPGGFNVVPGAAELTIDVRSATPDGYARLDPFVRDTLERIAAEEELRLEVRETHRKQPVALDAGLQELLEDAAREEGATTLRLPSGAGHDAMVLAHHVPAAMLFVPSRGGLSHTPDELSSPEHCELGARVLARAVRGLILKG
ncbi:MAG TPA: M20 family metallo-hydrolase [Gaiellaceae bacterium]|nr:M20 family metallo-hydrolase [Gaiellaceae bacterium]